MGLRIAVSLFDLLIVAIERREAPPPSAFYVGPGPYIFPSTISSTTTATSTGTQAPATFQINTSNYTYIGSYNDNNNDRTLANQSNSDLQDEPSTCDGNCSSHNEPYKYMGVEDCKCIDV